MDLPMPLASFLDLKGAAAADFAVSGAVVTYQGTTITSAHSVLLDGVNAAKIKEISGWEDSWWTIDKSNAAFYAESRTSIPAQVAIVRTEIQPGVIVGLINAELAVWSVADKGFKILKAAHPVFNQAMTNTTILTHLDF
jgi:hypothetical protein